MKNYWNKYLIILLLSIVQACTLKVYDQASCTDLVFKSFKGSPYAANEYNQHCQEVQTNYTAKICQTALSELILVGSLEMLRKKYGALIHNCFTENDLKNFVKTNSP